MAKLSTKVSIRIGSIKSQRSRIKHKIEFEQLISQRNRGNCYTSKYIIIKYKYGIQYITQLLYDHLRLGGQTIIHNFITQVVIGLKTESYKRVTFYSNI